MYDRKRKKRAVSCNGLLKNKENFVLFPHKLTFIIVSLLKSYTY
ncbi:hypothetical protein HMPREF0557_00183 [Listeria innocua ATCC 33091]|uniref:Uncharacterized protein n=1 Tax=Listeria innocua ATCC 33091 TaxID=1002366 RepID=A0AB72ZCQ9_LISIO|nr:hypothetical protein HMPREF0557_00183 [Listeria innocua ATCC 33091]